MNKWVQFVYVHIHTNTNTTDTFWKHWLATKIKNFPFMSHVHHFQNSLQKWNLIFKTWPFLQRPWVIITAIFTSAPPPPLNSCHTKLSFPPAQGQYNCWRGQVFIWAVFLWMWGGIGRFSLPPRTWWKVTLPHCAKKSKLTITSDLGTSFCFPW